MTTTARIHALHQRLADIAKTVTVLLQDTTALDTLNYPDLIGDRLEEVGTSLDLLVLALEGKDRTEVHHLLDTMLADGTIQSAVDDINARLREVAAGRSAHGAAGG